MQSGNYNANQNVEIVSTWSAFVLLIKIPFSINSPLSRLPLEYKLPSLSFYFCLRAQTIIFSSIPTTILIYHYSIHHSILFPLALHDSWSPAPISFWFSLSLVWFHFSHTALVSQSSIIIQKSLNLALFRLAAQMKLSGAHLIFLTNSVQLFMQFLKIYYFEQYRFLQISWKFFYFRGAPTPSRPL